jgi:single-strand DNA-binding protein
LTDVAEKYLKKGSKVYIEGSLRTRSWEDQENNTQYRTEINVDNLTMLGSQNSGGSPSQGQGAEPAKASAPASSSAADDSFEGDDDDLPF